MRPFATSTAVAALVLTWLLSWTGAADAHAFLRHAMPLVGSTIPSSPPNLTLDYTEGVEPNFCQVVVKDAQGQQVDKGDLHAAPKDEKRLLLGLQPLKPGAYTVEWHVTSVDTHHTEGTFTFTVQP
jgi:methionine-rich copper-binding protein CopC